MNQNINKKMKRIGIAGIVISILLGLEIEAIFYFVFGINPAYIPLIAIIALWIANTIIIACAIDEIMKFKIMLERNRKRISRA